ncbi:MAG: hypothetical protein OEZ43_09215 [Gammaproteobacteria bacterium]|nr:hypothetical protein [Gammaproteobacteria bacterium]
MSEPNFSESQLQQLVNTAIIRRIYEQNGEWVFVHMPSLINVFDLGWDSAFFFPWFPFRSLGDHLGSHVFLQYRMSQYLASSGAREWGTWQEKYFRFKLPFRTHDKTTRRNVDDYSQWQNLSTLAKDGYPVFYTTHTTLDRQDLSDALASGDLLDRTPALDVRDVVYQHEFVTFTESSSHFQLHGKAERVGKSSLSDVITRNYEWESIDDANTRLLQTLAVLGGEGSSLSRDVERIQQQGSVQCEKLPKEKLPYLMHGLIASVVHKHLGAKLLWLPAAN